ncbi:hypothetical protein SynBIOSE41_02317 [Synechococcus sp. BIOS-E4-1]|nr:hypothetical protein SynBIOSE41_02317 [Synechococcus sp. BIOS-E4-1]
MAKKGSVSIKRNRREHNLVRLDKGNHLRQSYEFYVKWIKQLSEDWPERQHEFERTVLIP